MAAPFNNSRVSRFYFPCCFPGLPAARAWVDEWPINSETLPTGFRRGYRIDAQRVMLGADQRRDTRACGTDRLGDNAVRLDRAGSGFVGGGSFDPANTRKQGGSQATLATGLRRPSDETKKTQEESVETRCRCMCAGCPVAVGPTGKTHSAGDGPLNEDCGLPDGAVPMPGGRRQARTGASGTWPCRPHWPSVPFASLTASGPPTGAFSAGT